MKKVIGKAVESGFLISLSLGLAYLFAFYYQKGILQYYDIPQKYIDLNISNVIEIFVYILLICCVSYAMLSVIVDNLPKVRSYKAKQLLCITIAFIILSAATIVLINRALTLFLIYVALYSIYIGLTLLIPIIKYRSKKVRYVEKLKIYMENVPESQRKESEYIQNTHFYRYRRVFNNVGLIAVFIIIVCNFFSVSGLSHSEDLEEYYVAKNYSEKIIVYYTQDYYVLMEEEKGILKTEYQIVPVEDIGTITKKHTGQLKMEKENLS